MTPAERLLIAFPRLTAEQAERVAMLRPEGSMVPDVVAVTLRLTGAVQGVYRPRDKHAGEEALAMSPAAAQVARSDALCLAHITRRMMQDALDCLYAGDILGAHLKMRELEAAYMKVKKL